MPRYFFNVYDGQNSIDEDGNDLPDFESARKEAINYAGALIEDHDTVDGFPDGWRMEVVDEQQIVVLKLEFSVTKMLLEDAL